MRTILIFLLYIVIYSTGCEKPDTDRQDVDPPVKGGLFFMTFDSIGVLNLEADTLAWMNNGHTYSGSFYATMNYDSGLLYKASHEVMTAYSVLNGTVAWHADPNFGLVDSYDEAKVTFSGNFMYFFAASYNGTYLVCLDKRTGLGIWKERISFGGSIAIGMRSPLVVGNKVFMSTLDVGPNKIFCFDATTGLKLWESAPGMGKQLEIYNNTIINLGDSIYCYDINDGHTIWKTGLPAAAAGSIVHSQYFKNGDKTLVAKSITTYAGTNDYSDFYWVSNSNGSILSSHHMNIPFSECIYKDNKIMCIYIDPPLSIITYDATGYNILWEHKTATSILHPGISVPHGNQYFNNLVISGDVLFYGENLKYFNAAAGNRIRAVDILTGKLLKEYTLGKHYPWTSSWLAPYFVIVDEKGKGHAPPGIPFH
jgi:outer membrane protein assembly factor BamB